MAASLIKPKSYHNKQGCNPVYDTVSTYSHIAPCLIRLWLIIITITLEVMFIRGSQSIDMESYDLVQPECLTRMWM